MTTPSNEDEVVAMLNVSIALEDSARRYPERPAVVMPAGVTGERIEISYADLEARANQVANLLADAGIGPGHNVALSCPNVPEFVSVYFGILKSGAAAVPLNILLQPEEITYHLEDSRARAYFCHAGSSELPLGDRGRQAFRKFRESAPTNESDDPSGAGSSDAEPVFFALPLTGADQFPASAGSVATSPDDTAVILYTSGTTGRPKGAELSHLNLLMNAIVCHDMFEEQEHNVLLAALPLFHAFGQTAVMNLAVRRAGTLVLLPRFDPVDALRTMRDERVTYFAGVPTMYWAMLQAVNSGQAEPPETLATAVSGGSAMPLDVLNGFQRTFGVTVREGYGLSETSPVATFNQPGRPAKPGSIGTPIWGVRAELVDEDWNLVEGEGPGEFAVSGHLVMKGYFRRPEETARVLRDGWFRTGDIATRDADGYYYIVDRAKDLIIRGGYNVYPREVEEALMSHPEVSLAAVVGVPDDRHGEEVKAFVIRTPGSELSEADLIAWASQELAGHKYPRIVEFREELPLTATGKILKRELR